MPTSSNNVPVRTFARVSGTLAQILSAVSIVAMIFMMLLVVYDVSRRNIGMTSIAGSIDYAEVALVVVAFFALGETQRRRDHVSVDAFLMLLPGKVRTVVRVVGQLLAIVVAGLLAYGAYDLFINAIETNEYRLGLVRVILWPARLGVFAGFLAWSLQLIVDLFRPEEPTSMEDALESSVPM